MGTLGLHDGTGDGEACLGPYKHLGQFFANRALAVIDAGVSSSQTDVAMDPETRDFSGLASGPLVGATGRASLSTGARAALPAVTCLGCELFILELTLQAWCHLEQSGQKMLPREDVNIISEDAQPRLFLIESVGRDDAPPAPATPAPPQSPAPAAAVHP